MTVAADSLRRNGTKNGPGRFARREERDRRRRARRRPPSPSSRCSLNGRKAERTNERMDGQADTGQDCHRSPGETVSQVFGGRVRDRPSQPNPVVIHWEKGRSLTCQIDTCHGIYKVSNEIEGRGVTDICGNLSVGKIRKNLFQFRDTQFRQIIWKWLQTILHHALLLISSVSLVNK